MSARPSAHLLPGSSVQHSDRCLACKRISASSPDRVCGPNERHACPPGQVRGSERSLSDRVYSQLGTEKRGAPSRPDNVSGILTPVIPRRLQGCNLAALLEAMQEHFSREPPVYAKPKDGESPRPLAHPSRSDSQGPDYSGRPPPPLPGTQASPSPLNRPPPSSHGSSDDRPPLPAKPGTSSLATTSRGVSPVAQPTALDHVQSPVVVGSVSAFRARRILM